MTVEAEHRGRFFEVPGATARPVGPNVYEIRIPATEAVRKRFRRAPEAEAWDGVVFALDEVETQPAVGTATERDAVRVTVVVLG